MKILVTGGAGFARKMLEYVPKVDLVKGLEKTIACYREQMASGGGNTL